MNEQNKTASMITPVELPAKRKRGRPRKDVNLLKKPSQQTIVASPSRSTREVQNIEAKPKESLGGTLVGRVVTGVIDGSFDAGYFITVKAGNSGGPLRGVVFQPGGYTPLSAANDVAPQAKMYQRTELLVPGPSKQVNGVSSQAGEDANQPVEIGGQSVTSFTQPTPYELESNAHFSVNNQSATNLVPVTILERDSSSSSLERNISIQQTPEFNFKIQSQTAPPFHKLRMVEQDEVMQVFEVSTPNVDPKAAKDVTLESQAILSEGRETNNKPRDVQDQLILESRIETDPFDDNVIKQSYLELLQTSLGSTNNQSMTQKVGAVESQDKDQLFCNDVKITETDNSSEVPKHRSMTSEDHVKETSIQPETLSNIELNNPVLELHEIPVTAQNQSAGEEHQAAEPKLQSSEIVHNEQVNTDINPHHSSFAQGHHAVESKLQPFEFVPMELNSTSLDLQTSTTAEDQSISKEDQEGNIAKTHHDLIQNEQKNPDLQLHQSVEPEPNKLIQSAARNPHLELNQSLFGESQLLEFIHEPLNFMMERPNSPKHRSPQNIHLEPKNNEVRNEEILCVKQITDVANSSEAGSKPEPSTEQETQNSLRLSVSDSAGCAAGKELTLDDVVQATEPQGHSRNQSEDHI